MNKTIISLALGLSLTFPALSQAACTRADLAGVWRIYAVFNGIPARCTVIMPSSGSTMLTSSTCLISGVTNGTPARGALGIDAGCHVWGQVSSAGLVRNLDAWISRGKDSMSGFGVNPANLRVGDTFTAVKQ